MKYSFLTMFLIVYSLCFFSCISTGVDAAFVQQFSDAEKADFFFLQGKMLYEKNVLEENDFSKIPEIRKLFKYALNEDPFHPMAPIYSERLELYAAEKYRDFIAECRNLLDQENRSSQDDFLLLVECTNASYINNFTKDILALKAQVFTIRRKFISERANRLKQIVSDVSLTTDAASIEMLAAESDSIFSELNAIGAYGKKEANQRMIVEDALMTVVVADMVQAESDLEKSRYGDVRKQVNNIEQKLLRCYSQPVHGLEEFKYKFYMKWVNALISVDALEQADRTIDMALAIKPTEEARYRKQLIADMIDKQPVKEEIPKPIAKKVNPDPEIVVETDFDEEFSSVLPTITEQIKQGNLVVAWDTLLEYEAKVKQEQNIATIDKKKGEIQQLSIQLYAAGVEAYNQEDDPVINSV